MVQNSSTQPLAYHIHKFVDSSLLLVFFLFILLSLLSLLLDKLVFRPKAGSLFSSYYPHTASYSSTTLYSEHFSGG